MGCLIMLIVIFSRSCGVDLEAGGNGERAGSWIMAFHIKQFTEITEIETLVEPGEV